MEQNRRAAPLARLQHRQKLIHIMDVPRPLDLRNHDGGQGFAAAGHEGGDILQMPGGRGAVYTHPKLRASRGEDLVARHGDRPLAGGVFSVGRNGVFEVGADNVDLCRCSQGPFPRPLKMWGHEMDHAFQPLRRLAPRGRRPRVEGCEKGSGRFDGHGGLRARGWRVSTTSRRRSWATWV